MTGTENVETIATQAEELGLCEPLPGGRHPAPVTATSPALHVRPCRRMWASLAAWKLPCQRAVLQTLRAAVSGARVGSKGEQQFRRSVTLQPVFLTHAPVLVSMQVAPVAVRPGAWLQSRPVQKGGCCDLHNLPMFSCNRFTSSVRLPAHLQCRCAQPPSWRATASEWAAL